jgi:hypothetical protein
MAFHKKGKSDSQLGYATMSITGRHSHTHACHVVWPVSNNKLMSELPVGILV